MSPKPLSILAVRLIVLYLLFGSLYGLGITIQDIALHGRQGLSEAVFELIVPTSYFVVLTLLLTFSKPIAEKISRGLPASAAEPHWTKVELNVSILTGISALIILSAIPGLVNLLYEILESHRNMISEGLAEKERLNRLVIGFVGGLIQVGIAVAVCVYAKRLALIFDRWQR